MKYKYIGDSMITVKSPCPQSGQRVELRSGDTVELDWKPGGHAQTLVLVTEEAPKVVETPKVVEAPIEVPKSKKPKFLSKKKKR